MPVSFTLVSMEKTSQQNKDLKDFVDLIKINKCNNYFKEKY